MNYRIICDSNGVIYTSPWMDLEIAIARAAQLRKDGMTAWVENRAGKRIEQ